MSTFPKTVFSSNVYVKETAEFLCRDVLVCENKSDARHFRFFEVFNNKVHNNK